MMSSESSTPSYNKNNNNNKSNKNYSLVELSDDEDEVISTPVPKSTKNLTVSAKQHPATLSTTKIRANDAFSPSTPTPSKQILENNRKKRRSSFAAVQGATSRLSASAATALQSKLPPDNVKTEEYHRHIQTDLPGPVKMRQLMIWACQKASKEAAGGSHSNFEVIADKIVGGLLENEIKTSWYQRIDSRKPKDEESIIYYLPNPQNQEISECIELYKNYHQKLEKECAVWEDLKGKTGSFELFECLRASKIDPENVKIDSTLNVLFAEEFQNLSKWLQNLPISIDRLDWNTKLALSFQDHAKQFCEGVFHQIFAKFFSSDLPRAANNKSHQRIEPMMILRALSSNNAN